MCGRFSLSATPESLQAAFLGVLFPAQFAPRYNIAPSQPVLAQTNDGKNAATFLLWGLIPGWSKDPSIAARLINARAETLAEKPSFRGSLKYKRCLVFADGFYEWQAVSGQKAKIPHHIGLASGQPFALAGLWDEWHGPDGSQVQTCTIITTAPNALMAPIHNRMPVILPPAHYADWLNPAPVRGESLLPLLQPFPAEEMRAYPVSARVNSPTNDTPECISPLS